MSYLLILCVLSLLLLGQSTDYSKEAVHSKLRRVAKLLGIDDEKVNKALNLPTEPLSQETVLRPSASSPIPPLSDPPLQHPTTQPTLGGGLSLFLLLGIIIIMVLFLLLLSFKHQILSLYQKPAPQITTKNDKESTEITSKIDKESTERISKKDNDSTEIISKKDNESTEIISKKDKDSTEIISKKDIDSTEITSKIVKESTEITSKKDNESTEITSKKLMVSTEIISKNDNESPEETSKNQNHSDNNNKEFRSKTIPHQLISHESFPLPKVTGIENLETSLGFCQAAAKQLLQRTIFDIENIEPENKRTDYRIQVLYLSQVMAEAERKKAVTLLQEDLIRKKTKLVENQNQDLVKKRRDEEKNEKKNTARYILFLIFISGFLTWFYTLQHYSTTFSFSHLISTISWWFTFLKINISIPGGNLFGLNTFLSNLLEIFFGICILLLCIVVTWVAPKISFPILLALFSTVFTSSIFLLVVCLSPVMLVVYFYMYNWLTTPIRIFAIGLVSLGLGLAAGYTAAMLDPLNTKQNFFGNLMINILPFDKLEEL